MSETKERLADKLANYPYHLPDKPLPPGPYISYEEFLDWADEDTLAEWVNGEIVMASPATVKHQRISKFLLNTMETFVKMYDLGEIFQAPFQMKLPGKEGSGREPDLVFLAKQNFNRLERGLIRGAGDLVIEVVSEESIERDRVDKFQEYEAGGVPEYWLIDSTIDEAEFYQLDENERYQRIMPDAQGKYYSKALPSFWLKPDWFWRSPAPNPETILRVMAGNDYLEYFRKVTEEVDEI